MSACASVNQPDPLESFNRPIFEFNDTIDRHLIKPSAEFYRDATPNELRQSLNNFFNNLDAPYSAVNSLLQGEWSNAGKSLGRFLINSTLGIFGLFDVAGNDMGIRARDEDFGQTLGAWGVDSGAYVVLPFLPPSNPRDLISRFAVDQRFNLLPKKFQGKGERARIGWMLFHIIRGRERLLDAEARSAGMNLDSYVFYRNILTQSRQNAVFNGKPPLPPVEDESWLDENLKTKPPLN